MVFTKITNEEIVKRKPSVRQVRLKKRTPIYVIFENIRSLYNVGAMFRSSDAALVSKVFLTGITGKPPHKDIDKTALGATDVVPWQYVDNTKALMADLKSQGVFIAALELTRESVPYSGLKYPFPVCLVVGNEINGVSDDILRFCDAAVDIPMLGRANSLNVATAYGIALFEILRQYRSLHV